MTRISPAKDPARNVWLQLGMPDAEEHYLKAELVLRLDRALRESGLTQKAGAKRIGATQPELSKILRGKFSEVSIERLIRFLTALGYPIEIKIGTAKPKGAGDVTVRDTSRRTRERKTLRGKPKTKPHSIGFKRGIDLDKLGQLADQLEAEAYANPKRKRR